MSTLFTLSTSEAERCRPKVKERTLEIVIIVLFGVSLNATKKTINTVLDHGCPILLP